MSTFGIKEQFRGPVVIAATGLFLCFSILFFMPAEIPHKITLPVATLALASLWLCPWQISAALIFSAAGDYMGSCGNFLWQMTFFAIGHILYIIYFIGRYLRNDMKMTGRRKGYLITIVICAAALLTFALCRIIPQAYLKEGAMIGTGTGIYATLICLMLVSALM